MSIELIGFSGYSIFLLENNSWGILSEESLNVQGLFEFNPLGGAYGF